ncbi:hypothetical protein [Altericista sp. CCNU0014]|uniref:hypothetical protein n=1 Tax=Altericista sp. CCNU0014 TaxID=3082949 RepID=UPI00384C8369
MKMQWKMYRELELIPESTPTPKPSLLAWLTAPVRRPFADIFTRDLSHRHQILLLKRCLNLSDAEQTEGVQGDDRTVFDEYQGKSKSPTPSFLTQQQQITAQQWLNRGGMPWWTWYDL